MILYRNGILDKAKELDDLISQFAKMEWTDHPTLNETFATDQLKSESGKMSRVALNTFTDLTGEGIRPYAKSLLVTPGNGYLSSVESLCHQLLLYPKELMLVLSSRDLFGKAFAEFIEPRLSGTQVYILDPTLDHDTKRTQGCRFLPGLAVVYGSSPTCADWRNDLFHYTKAKVITHGSKASIGYHARVGILMEYVNRYAEDFFLYDGTGCLNTSCLYVRIPGIHVETQHEAIESVKKFAHELGERRGEYMAPYQGVSTMNGIRSSLMNQDKPYTEVNGVFIREPGPTPILAGGHGTAMVTLVNGMDEIQTEWEGYGGDLSSATLDSVVESDDILDSDVHTLFEMGCSRVTRPGKAQYPSHRWCHDGRPILPDEMWLQCGTDW